MYRKKEVIMISSLFLIFGIIVFYLKVPLAQENNYKIQREPSFIQINVEGEVVRRVELICYHPMSYGALFFKINNCLNEFSDLSDFNLDEMIISSKTIVIPTLDIKNNYKEEKVYINEGVLEDLIKLPQIGEKRAQKIVDYIEKNGYINTWEKLWEVINVPKESREKIMDQAVL